ncbi:hypothetical protein HDU89_006310 [Geranomyces variabilis]|nr:hypothetical protein HDU89_006310 [Geranomyces variabilis]
MSGTADTPQVFEYEEFIAISAGDKPAGSTANSAVSIPTSIPPTGDLPADSIPTSIPTSIKTGEKPAASILNSSIEAGSLPADIILNIKAENKLDRMNWADKPDNEVPAGSIDSIPTGNTPGDRSLKGKAFVRHAARIVNPDSSIHKVDSHSAATLHSADRFSIGTVFPYSSAAASSSSEAAVHSHSSASLSTAMYSSLAEKRAALKALAAEVEAQEAEVQASARNTLRQLRA